MSRKGWLGDAGAIGGWLLGNAMGELGIVGSIIGRRLASMSNREIKKLEQQIETIAVEKLRADLMLSICHRPNEALMARKEAKKRLTVAIPDAKIDIARSISLVSQPIPYMWDQAGNLATLGKVNTDIFRSLDAIRDRYSTNELRVNCECIEPAGIVALTYLKELYAVPMRIFSGDFSGREQVVRISQDPTTQLLITANAAYNLSATSYASCYRQVMELHWEEQRLLVWGSENKKSGRVFIYDSSSASEQYYKWKDYLDSKNKREERYESLGWLFDEIDSGRLSRGDYIIAWEPLISGLQKRTKGRLKSVRKSNFRHLISIYAREDLVRRNKEMASFLEAFRYIWVACMNDQDLAISKLLTNKELLLHLTIGAGLSGTLA